MRVSSVTAHRVRIPFKAVFAHAMHSRRVAETIVLVIESESGHIGVGEVLPRSYLTGETLESASQKEIPALVRRWFGRSFEGCSEVVDALREELRFTGRALATLAGWELAVLDMAGKAFGFAAGDVMGPAAGRDLEPGVVIDFGVPTHGLEKHCMLLRLAGRRHVKVKVGLDDDLHRLTVVQDVLGVDHALRLDANGVWTADYAIEMLKQMRRFNIRSIEQPVPQRDLAGMRRVREESGVPVVADESLCTLHDGQRLMAAHAADIFNIRIAKCGGFLACLRLVKLANEAGLGCQLGTLVGETGILSRAAEIFGRRVEGFEFLEGKGQNKLLLVEDIVEPVPGAPREGLGVAITSNSLDHWAVCTPTVFKAPQRRPI